MAHAYINEALIESLYNIFVVAHPFNQYKFPRSSKVEFAVYDDPEIYGSYSPEPHLITISTAKCSHLDTVCKTVLHEMCHMALYVYSPDTELYLKHTAQFKRLQSQVAKLYGFDPLDL